MGKQRSVPRGTTGRASVLRRRRSAVSTPWWLLGGFAVLAAATLVIVAFGVRGGSGGSEDAHPELVGSEAFDFSLPVLGGGTFSLADYRGDKNVLVYFNEGHG